MALLVGALWSGIVGTILFGLLLQRRIAAEEQAHRVLAPSAERLS
jgi:hypothetical protein